MCIPLENSYIHHFWCNGATAWYCVSLSKTVIFISFLIEPWRCSLCIPLENSYIHPTGSFSLLFLIVYPSRKQLYSSDIMWDIVALELCIPLENSYIHLLLLLSSKLFDCVSLSKTVIFILKRRYNLYKRIVYPSRKQLYSSIWGENYARILIVYPSRKQLYSSLLECN